MPPPWGGVGGGGASGLPSRVRAPLPGSGRLERRLLVGLAAGLAAGAVGAGEPGGGPAQRRAELIGVDFGDVVLGAVLVGPAALLGSADHDHPGTLGQGVGGVFGLVAPDVDGVEAGLPVGPGAVLLPAAGGDGDAEVGDLQAGGGVAQLGSAVRLPTRVTRSVSDMTWSLLGTRWGLFPSGAGPA